MTGPNQSIPDVLVADIDADSSLVPRPGRAPLLVLRKGQSFDSAFEYAQNVLPDLHPEVVRTLVRDAMPNAARSVAAVATMPTGSTWVPGASHQSPRARRRRRKLLVRKLVLSGAALGFLLSGGVVGGLWWHSATSRTDLAAFSEARFGEFEKAMGLSCEELTALTARCTVMSGKDMGDVLIAEAEIADGHLTYKLQRGSERTFVMVFEDEDSARLWTAENADGIAPTFDLDGRPLLDPRGHYLAFGTSEPTVEGVQAALPQEGEEQPLAEGINDLAAATMEAMPAPGATALVPGTGQGPARVMAPAHEAKPSAPADDAPVKSPPPTSSPSPTKTPAPTSTPQPDSSTGNPSEDLDTRSEEPASGGDQLKSEQSSTGEASEQPRSDEDQEGAKWDDFSDWSSGGWGDNWVSWTWLDRWDEDQPGNSNPPGSGNSSGDSRGSESPEGDKSGENRGSGGSQAPDTPSAYDDGGPLWDVERPVKERSADW